MPEWLIILIVFFVATRVLRKRRFAGDCMGGGRHRLHRTRRETVARADAARMVPAPRPESPMEALQRRYVEGGITVEQYEAELDRMYRSS